MKRCSLLLVLSLTATPWGGGLLGARYALCASKDVKAAEADRQPGPQEEKRERTPQRTLRMEEIEIHGDVEKPKTMFVIPRTPLPYSRRSREKDFTGEILDPMMKQWIEDTQRWRAAVPPP
jgi:hypothetical protein